MVKDPSAKIDENTAQVTAEGRALGYTKFRWLMLNKPEDTTSTTEEGDSKSVMKLLPPEFSGRDMFPCGRLDIDTTGLLLITDDGQTAHNLLSPKHHCEKTYRFTCLPVDEEAVAKYNADPLSGFTFTAGAYRDMFDGLSRLYPEKIGAMRGEVPVLLLSGDKDPVGANGAGVKKVAEEIKAAGVEKVDVKLYPGGRHEMFNEINRGEAWNDLIQWIEAIL